jgi:hypothetical protein
VAQPGRQELPEGGERPERGLFEPGTRDRGGLESEGEGERERLVVVEQQRGQIGAGVEAVTAVGPHRRLHVVAHLAQPVDVAAHGAVTDAEPLGQQGAGPISAGLQQRQQRQQSRCRGGHAIHTHSCVGQDPTYMTARVRARREHARTITPRSHP